MKVTEGYATSPQYFAKMPGSIKPGTRASTPSWSAAPQSLNPTFELACQRARRCWCWTCGIRKILSKGLYLIAFSLGWMALLPLGWRFNPDLQQPILIVAPKAGRRNGLCACRVGYDNAIGFLEGGFEVWKAAGKMLIPSTPLCRRVCPAIQGAARSMKRYWTCANPEKWMQNAWKPAEHFALDFINDNMAEIRAKRVLSPLPQRIPLRPSPLRS